MSINRAVTSSGFPLYYLNLGYEPTLYSDVEHSEMVGNTLNESLETFLHQWRMTGKQPALLPLRPQTKV